MVELEQQEKMSVSDDGVARQVVTNTMWGSFGRLSGGVFAFATVAILSRSLGPDGYGIYATVLAFFYLFNALADGGFYTILLRDAGRVIDASQLFVSAVTLRLSALAVSFTIGLGLFAIIPQYQGLFILAPLAVLAYLFLSLLQLFMAILQKHFAVSRATIAEIVSRALQLCVVAALFYGFGASSPLPYLGALAFASGVQFLLLLRAVRSFVKFSLAPQYRELSRMLRESFPVAVGLVFTLIYFRLDTVLLSLLKDPYAVGVYNLSYKLLEQLIFFPAMFLGVLTPVLSRLYTNDPVLFRATLLKAATIIGMGAVPVVFGGWFLATPIVLLLGGEAFIEAAAPLQVLLAATGLIFFGTILGASVIIAGRQRAAIPVYAIGMFVNLVLNFLFIPSFSYMGAAWATVVTEVIIVAGLWFILRASGIVFFVPKLVRISVASLVMIIPMVIFGTDRIASLGLWSLAIWIPACAFLYAGACLFLRVVSIHELKLFFRK